MSRSRTIPTTVIGQQSSPAVRSIMTKTRRPKTKLQSETLRDGKIYAERAKVMRELSTMGITAGSIFPGLDGMCAELKERNFPS